MTASKTNTVYNRYQSMQTKEKNPTDARSFPEIWATFTEGERGDLIYDLMKSKCCTTRQAVYNWANGLRTPGSRLVRDEVAKVVGKFIGSRVLGATLFPNSLR